MKPVHQLFEKRALANPDNIAVEIGDLRKSYGELNSHANLLARILMSFSVQKDVFVGVLMTPGYHYISSMLAIFKANGVYLPLAWDFTPKRFQQIFNTSFSGIIIIEQDGLEHLEELVSTHSVGLKHVIVIGRDGISVLIYNQGELEQMERFDYNGKYENPGLTTDLTANNYIYYTSGSTGEGKAIVGNHKSLSHFITWEINEFGLGAHTRVSQIAQITFDASLKDIFTALCSGGTLCIPESHIKQNLPSLVEWIERAELTLLQCVPSIFRLVTDELLGQEDKRRRFPKLRQVVLAGEMLYAKDLINWREAVGDHTEVANLYGTTESTILKTFHRIKEIPSNPSQIIHVGIPIDNTSVAIINDNHICRPGEKGEIFIKSDFMSNGYYKNDMLNTAVFVQNPLINNKEDIVYKTGDVGRYLKTGEIEVLGRLDNQVKVNGVRVELGEVEGAMLSVKGIEKAVVVPHASASGQLELIGYYSNPDISTEDIRKQLENDLSKELIPTYFIHVDQFPLNINGKVNKRLLPRPETIFRSSDKSQAPVGDTEIQLAKVWQEVLGTNIPGRNVSFFDLGGNSIKALQITSMVYKVFGVNLKLTSIFAHPSIKELASVIEGAGKNEYKPIDTIEEQDIYELSYEQSRIWALLQLENDQGAYNMHAGYEISGLFEEAAFYQALEFLCRKHESLRTSFVEVEGKPRQRVIDKTNINPETFDLTKVIDPEKKAGEIAVDYAKRPFDLTESPLLRVAILRMPGERIILLLTVHHIIADGWSTEILSRELAELYGLFRSKQTVEEQPLAVQYKDYVAWQQDQLSDTALESHRSYWLNKFSGEIPVLPLATDKPRPAVKTYNGHRIRFDIDTLLATDIEQFCKEHGVSQYVFFMAIMNHLFSLYTGSDDIVIGSPSAGRNHPDLENQIGFFLNNIALRTQFSQHDTFATLLENVKNIVNEAQDHNIYPFHKLVNELGIKRDMSRSVLYDIGFTWHEVAGNDEMKGTDVQMRKFDTPFVAAKADIWFHGMKTLGGITFFIEYNTDLFFEERMYRLSSHVDKIIEGVVKDPKSPLHTYGYLSEKERQLQLADFNATESDAGRHFLIAFDEVVKAFPDEPAISFKRKDMSYRKLDQLSDQLAAYLQNEWQVEKEDVIAVMTGRSVECIVALLAIFKAGGAFLPIDASLPAHRKAILLDDAKVTGVLTESELLFDLPQESVSKVFALDLQLDELRNNDSKPDKRISSNDLAYIIYTSGSTGKPKGVCVGHKSFSNYLTWANNYYFDNIRGHIFGWFTSLSFDLTLTSIFTTLLRGDKLVICAENENDALLAQMFSPESEINTIKTTPSHLNILRHIPLSSTNVDTIIVGGEKLHTDQVELLYKLSQKINIFNEYGPTETTVGCTVKQISASSDSNSIGKPIGNTKAYVLDQHFNLLPIGFPGQLCISGYGVARGYLNNDEATKGKFISLPHISGDILYCTGDQAKWTEDGELIYLGRKDNQLKIRGYRVELQEVESWIVSHKSVQSAAVLPLLAETEVTGMIAFYTGDPNIDLKLYLKQYLPDHMIPVSFHWMETLPVTSNGKLDTGKLMGYVQSKTKAHYTPPQNQLQEQLQLVWQSVLLKENIGIHDDFFDLGGESLKAIQLVYEISRQLEVKLKPSDIFLYPTIESLSKVIDRAQEESFTELGANQIEEQEHYPVSHAQKRLWYFDQVNRDHKNAYHVPAVYHFRGHLNIEAFTMALQQMMDRHESLRTIFINTDEGIRQRIVPLEQLELPLTVEDLHNVSDNRLQSIQQAFASEPFDLDHGPLFRAKLVKIKDDHYVVLFTIHHIISDEWSFEIFNKEVMALYQQLDTRNEPQSQSLAFQYKEFAIWQNQLINGQGIRSQRDYWLRQFTTEPPLIDLPFAKPRPKLRSFSGARANFNLENDLVQQLRKHCNELGVSMFMLLMGALKVLIHRYTRESDIVVSTPTVGRDHPDLEHQIGNFVNILPIRTILKGEQSYADYLKELKMVMLGAYDNHAFPFDYLLEELGYEPELNRQPLFDIGFTWHTDNMVRKADHTSTDGLDIRQDATEFVVAKADLWLHAMDRGSEVGFSLIYSTDLFDAESINSFTAHYKQLLQEIAGKIETPLSQLEYLTPDEITEIQRVGRNVVDLNAPFVIELFEKNVAANPDAIAVTFNDRSYTYSELNNKVNKLALLLRDNYNIEKGDVVGVVVHRSEWIIVSLLAILKVGAVYLPSDPDNPKERLSYILANSQVKALISQSELLIEMMDFYHSSLVIVDMELGADDTVYSNPGIEISVHDPAYMIYTSGTSGEPKGVMVTHGSLMNLLAGLRHTFDYNEVRKFALIASISFDSSLKQMLQPLMTANQLIIVDNIRDIRRLTNTLCRQKINVITITPTVLQTVVNELVTHKKPNWLTHVFCGGEILTATFANQLLEFFPEARVVNIYGPTETTDLATTYHITKKQEGSVPIGRPLPNCEIYIMDEQKQLLPIGSKGEIHIGGKGVSLGYVHDPERSLQKFITHPFRSSEKVYSTGDIGYIDAQGRVRITGRADNQIKVRGHRIELGEIQNALVRYPGIERSVITTRGEGADKEIVAYVVEKEMIKMRPSWAEQYVYDDMAYYAMSNDNFRNEKYRKVISEKVRDKVVLEIGPGSEAILSLMCAECGAKKVYAVEILEESYQKAKRRVADLGLSDKIIVIHGDVMQVELPEKVDVCVSEIAGAIGGSQGAARIMNESRKLMKENSEMIPARSISKIAAVSLPSDNFEYAFDDVGLHYVNKIFDKVGYKFDLRLSLENLSLNNLVSSADVFEELDYNQENPTDHVHDILLKVEKDATVHGFVVWLQLYLDEEEQIDTLTNKEQKLWLPIYFPVFPQGVSALKGDQIRIKVERKLSKNGLHPDYFMRGILLRSDHSEIPFHYDSYNEEKIYKGNAFYKKLFENDKIRTLRSIDHNSIIKFLADYLPHYMLPTYVLKVDTIPVTVNGKTDFKALPSPADVQVEPSTAFIEPANKQQEQLLEIWKEVLNRDTISVEDTFFAVGGHSLRAAQLISRIQLKFNVDFDLKDVFDNPTVIEMSHKISQMQESSHLALLPVEEQDHYPVSHAQKRLWLLHQANTDMIAFSNPMTLELNGEFDLDAFQKAYTDLVGRHEIMRVNFITVGGEPRQKYKPLSVSLSKVVFHDLTIHDQKDSELKKKISSFINTPFDLSTGPLVKAEVAQLEKEKFIWMFSMHHIISDAWSMGVVFNELLELYEIYKSDGETESRPLAIQYKDFTAWQLKQLSENDGKHRQWWLEQLDDVPELHLPYDFAAPEKDTLEGDHVTVNLDRALSSQLMSLSTRQGTSLFMTLSATVVALLYKYSGQTDIVIGTNVAGRDHTDLEDQVGFYLNTLPLRMQYKEADTFLALLEEVKNVTLGAFQHQLYPYDLLVSDLREHGIENPLFNVEVELINTNMGKADKGKGLDDVSVKEYKNDFSISKDELSFRFIEDKGHIILNIGFKTDLFEKATIERMMQHYIKLTKKVLQNNEAMLSDIDYLSEEDREQLTAAFNTLE